MVAPHGYDRRTALQVRKAVLKGRRIDDPQLSSAVEFYVRKITKTYELQERLRVLWVIGAASFAIAFGIGLFSAESLWQVAVNGLAALVMADMAATLPRRLRNGRKRLEVNQT